MNEVLLRAEAISRTFGRGSERTVALKPTSLVVRQGDRITLVGPSGGGKSTLLHLLAGLDEPTEGRVTYSALPIAPFAPGGIAMVFQGPSLLPSLTVIENVMFPLILHGVDGPMARGRAEEVLREFEITALAEKLPEELFRRASAEGGHRPGRGHAAGDHAGGRADGSTRLCFGGACG